MIPLVNTHTPTHRYPGTSIAYSQHAVQNISEKLLFTSSHDLNSPLVCVHSKHIFAPAKALWFIHNLLTGCMFSAPKGRGANSHSLSRCNREASARGKDRYFPQPRRGDSLDPRLAVTPSELGRMRSTGPTGSRPWLLASAPSGQGEVCLSDTQEDKEQSPPELKQHPHTHTPTHPHTKQQRPATEPQLSSVLAKE